MQRRDGESTLAPDAAGVEVPPPLFRRSLWFWLHTVVLVPRNLAVALLLVYRRFISPLYGDVCRFAPTCSAYGLGAVQEYGVILGSAMTLWRIARCNPWNPGGIDPVPVRRNPRPRHLTRRGFVVSDLV